MRCQKVNKAAEKEAQVQETLKGLENKVYSSIRYTAKAHNVLASTLNHRFNGCVSRVKSYEEYQLLTPNKENELVR